MDKQPKIDDWQDFAHSVEVLAAAAVARSEPEGHVAAPQAPDLQAPDSQVPGLTAQDWQDLAHSVEVMASSALAAEQLREATAKPGLRLIASNSNWAARAASGLSRVKVTERSAMAMLSAAAAVLVVAALGTLHFEAGPSGGSGDRVADRSQRNSMQVASAQAEAGRVAQSLRCRSGLDCWSDGATVIRSVAGTPARITMGTEDGRRDIEARLDRGSLPAIDVTFDVASATLTDAARAKLDAVALAVHGIDGARGPSSFAIIGAADADEGNAQELSELRARAVADYLIQSDAVERQRLDVFGRGSAIPAATADKAPGQNRRVLLVNLGHLEPSDVGAASSPAQCEQYLPHVNRTVPTPCR